MKKYAQAEVGPGEWVLPKNNVWNLPTGRSEVPFDIELFHGRIMNLVGLAVTQDGKVFGYRLLQEPKESGYHMGGRVTVHGKKYRAFTSTKLFRRSDGSLCDVAILMVCDYP